MPTTQPAQLSIADAQFASEPGRLRGQQRLGAIIRLNQTFGFTPGAGCKAGTGAGERWGSVLIAYVARQASL